MSVLTKDIIASTYVLLHNASESELDLPIVYEQLGSLLNIMQYEKVFGNLDDIIEKETITFDDGTGIEENSISNFGDAVYLEFNEVPIEECTVGMLDFYYESNIQRVAFWTDESSSTKYAQLSIPQNGTLKIWHEPDIAQTPISTGTVKQRESLKWCIATRLANACLPYVMFSNPVKMANKANLSMAIDKQAKHWETIYLELVNRLGTNRPFARLPFSATSGID